MKQEKLTQSNPENNQSFPKTAKRFVLACWCGGTEWEIFDESSNTSDNPAGPVRYKCKKCGFNMFNRNMKRKRRSPNKDINMDAIALTISCTDMHDVWIRRDGDWGAGDSGYECAICGEFVPDDDFQCMEAKEYSPQNDGTVRTRYIPFF